MSKKKKTTAKKAVVESEKAVPEKTVIMECSSCKHRYPSSEGEWCPKCLERGRPVKEIEVSEKAE